MKIIKRNGSEAEFDSEKIAVAVTKANNACEEHELTEADIDAIAANIMAACEKMNRTVSVEEVQDMVETEIMHKNAYQVARGYIKYRYNRSLVRRANTTDARILSLIECNNEEVMQENSNKDPVVNSVQRDYMA